jgi:beta propeller repeat protein
MRTALPEGCGLVCIVSAIVVAACSDGATEVGQYRPAVDVVPPTAELLVGDTLRLAVEVHDAAGVPPGALLTWQSEDPAVATVDDNGLVTALQPGLVDICVDYRRRPAGPIVRGMAPTALRPGLVTIYAEYQRTPGGLTARGSASITVNCVTPPPEPVPVSLDPAGDAYTAIWGTRIVWMDWRNKGPSDANSDIYMYDIATGEETQLTTNVAWQGVPDIWGDRVVWSDTRDGMQAIYLLDLSTGQERRVFAAPRVQSSPAIEGDRIVWQANDGIDYDIYMYDLGTSSFTQLTDEPGQQMNPRISGHWVVWADSSAADWDVVAYDLDSGQTARLTDGESGNQLAPDVSGDLVVWQDRALDIWVQDLSTGTRRVLTDGTGVRTPAIDGDWAIWEGSNSVVVRNVETDEEWRVEEENVFFSDPDISGRRFVWIRGDIQSGANHIYMAEIPVACDAALAGPLAAGNRR